jgi:hypothetical protein
LKLNVLWSLLAAFITLTVLSQKGADATSVQYTAKQLVITIVVTPSPISALPHSLPASKVIAQDNQYPIVQLAHKTARQAGNISYHKDFLVALATQGNTPVKINTKADPTAAFLHLTPNNFTLNAAYGANTYLCAYRVFAQYPTQNWEVTDWVYGTTASGGGGVFPTWNAPSTSNLSWLAEGITSVYATFSNGGSPGQKTFSGNKGTSQNACIDLSLTVPNGTPAGTYTTVIQYNLILTY